MSLLNDLGTVFSLTYESLFPFPLNSYIHFALVDVKLKFPRMLFSAQPPSHLYYILFSLLNSVLDVLVSLGISNGVSNANGMT